MRPVTVALLVAGAAGAGAGVYFLVIKPRQAAAAAAAGSSALAAPAAVSTKTPTSIAGVNVGKLLTGDHVDRKNALAPAILSNFGVPTSIATPVANIAGKLSLSSYAERYITTKVPVVGAIAEAPINVTKKAVSVATSAVSAVGSAISSLF